MILWFVLFGCGEDITEVPVVCSDSITYATAAEPFLRTYCTGCHASTLEPGQRYGAPAQVNLDTFADAKEWALRSYVRAVHFQTMPPAGGITELERERFKQWALCGTKGEETNTPQFTAQPRVTSRSIFTMFSEAEDGRLTLERLIQEDEEVAPENFLTREEHYRFEGPDVVFEGYNEWSTEGDLISRVRFDPPLPMGLDNWVDSMEVTATIQLDGTSWTEEQSWSGVQYYQSLWELDIHDRETNPLLIHWWNDQGEEWGWRTSSDKILSSAFGVTIQGLHWESMQFSGPDMMNTDLTFPISEEQSWIDWWIEWRE